MDALETEVLEILAEACGDPRVLENPDLDLREGDLLDSFAWVQLLELLEDRFGLELWPTQVSRAEAATPRAMAGLVRRRLEEKAPDSSF